MNKEDYIPSEIEPVEEMKPLIVHYQCPKCGLYVSPIAHTDAACERVRALYPMLLCPPKEFVE